MCGLCGVLGADGHWSDSASHPGVFAARDGAPTRRQERLARVALTNRILGHYGLKLGDWQGVAYLLSGRTGRSEVIDHLGALWPMAETMAKRPCDPLDEGLIETLERS